MDIPQHIAIIMDGNGRWAKQRHWPRIMGHREGARNVKRIATSASNAGIKILTLYGFSVENWSRPEREVSMLFRLMKVYVNIGHRLCQKNNIKFRIIGDIDGLPEFLRNAFLGLIEATKKNSGMILQCAVNYGSRDEIVRGIRKIAERVSNRDISISDITEKTVSDVLDTEGQKDPDLVIRTSGEYRISNYLLWQSAYSEFYFSDVFWPDFDETCLMNAIESFTQRQRRFGKTGEQIIGESLPS